MVALAPLAAPCAAAPAAARRCAGRATPCAVTRHAGTPAASARGARLVARRVAASRTPLVCSAAAQSVGAASSTADAPAAADAALGPGVRPLHVLIAGGGIGGLVLAKGAPRWPVRCVLSRERETSAFARPMCSN
jgi:hypothetical protein